MAVTLCAVGPRDGLQNEADTLAPAPRADLVRRLAAGLLRIEAVSFVSAERVPQMAGAEEVVEASGEVEAELSGGTPGGRAEAPPPGVREPYFFAPFELPESSGGSPRSPFE